ncbi:pyridoxine 5'-phosphate synthase [Actimicrobium sp. CCI2.3]|uniref:pyridoxine 5'-phosphate synthase n=1 Tax=Actimicrobium sp. CCI2.3 TaxID=3048616 RepID=UPI002AB53136|nr:pyridoxine 5'-phosphate synthase [Actimicrobium sp. CCI2.3]MDY7575123.1 pyridoxine 5'-phosphate synthase [Actimicrobium sp. CCI2.3]MEB0023625.1 pyridoxine 5'-phosphate synthase [Actimicrobium sp. CCI2.3]
MSYLNPHSTGPDFYVDLMPLVRLRSDRPGPDLVQAARLAQAAGADGISLLTGEVAPAVFAAIVSELMIKLHLRLPVGGQLLAQAISMQPQRVCMVMGDGNAEITQQLQAHGIELAFAIETDLEQVQAAHAAGAYAIEFDASMYGTSTNAVRADEEFERLATCTAAATRLGMQVQIAHGLDLTNAARLAALEDVMQIQVGQSLLIRAIAVGWQTAVGDMKAILTQARRH